MAINFTRVGAALAVPAAEVAVLQETLMQQQWATQYHPETVLGALNVIIGAGLSFMMPYTFPHIADGVLDAGAAMLGLRAGANIKGQMAPPATYRGNPAPRMVPAPAQSHSSAPAQSYAPAVGKQRTGTLR